MIEPEQIRAARGFLGWSREDLSKRAGMTVNTIKNIEDRAVRSHTATLNAIAVVFQENNVEFLANGGVRLKDDMLTVLEGTDAYIRLMDDIYYTLKNPDTPKEISHEVLFFNADDRVTGTEAAMAEDRLRSLKIRFRNLIEAGNSAIRGPVEEYRALPSQYFNHDLLVVYADKVATVLDKGEKILLVRNASQALTMRNLFNFIWKSLRDYQP